ncbi:MAG: ComEC/Rec2 family competence protein, partial [Actinomycetia bacterium]|nr:ComEC/Rec2 family competence protein [Actinomycetes bacterium]
AVHRRARTTMLIAGVFVVLGMASGSAAAIRVATTRTSSVPVGGVELTFGVVEDASTNRYGIAVGEPRLIDGQPWNGPRIAVEGLDESVEVGSTVTARGTLRSGVRRIRDEIVAGTFSVDALDSVRPSHNPAFLVGNAIRRRVQSTFGSDRRSDGLILGLLIGDTRRLGAVDLENLRRSGLAHFVAVSGSNVAVFMLAWWIVTAPLSIRPRLRALLGAAGLAVFVVVTRWEPSVIRASVMTAVPLVGASLGVPVDPWMALGVAVTTLLLVSGDLLGSVGFQLSVMATAGVLVGVALSRGRQPRWLWMPLLVTVSAQVAVAPVILAVFGSMPLVAPVANLVVAPLVTAATVLGGLTLVVAALYPVASVVAQAVLTIADIASAGPQLGVAGVGATIVTGTLVAARVTRPVGVAAALLVMLIAAGQSPLWPAVPTLVALDVGQGDAILLQDPSGRSILIDGGPDPGTLDRALRRHGVSRLDVVVATHGDADHVAGLVEVLGAYEVGELWIARFGVPSDLLAAVVDAALVAGTPVVEVEAGTGLMLGVINIEVVGPLRRYDSDNDGSVAIMATAGRSAFIPGDIEAIAQRELPPLAPDVLIVPHHGSGSTDSKWLERTVGEVAVLSYGENRYGHPNPQIVAVLEASAADLRHTFGAGDVVVPLARGR